MTGWPFATCLTFGPYGAFACGLFSEDPALEAWERQTTGGVVIRHIRGLQTLKGIAYIAGETHGF